jgi:hypothetical protein
VWGKSGIVAVTSEASPDFDERTKHRDKEKEYKNLRNNLSKSLDGLKLPNIKETNRIGRRQEKEGDGKERMLVRLPKEDDDAIDGERHHPEFLRRKKRESVRSRGFRKSRGDRGGRHANDGDSAYEDMSEDEYPADPMTLLSDSGMAGSPSDLSDMDPYLRYSHGVNPNPDGDEYMKRQMEKNAQKMMNITGFMSEKSFCSCGSGHREVAPCTECHRTEFHSKKCSRRRKDRMEGRGTKGANNNRGLNPEDIDNPQTLIGEREASHRCLKCGKAVKREISYVSGMGRPWSRDSSASSGSYRLIRSSSESRIGTPEKDRSSRSRSVSPPRGKHVSIKNKTSGEMLLDNLERKLREGAFDYDVNVRSVDDIDQTLRIPRDGGDSLKADDKVMRMRKPRAKIDMYRDAYIKALSVARGRSLPSEPWMLGNRTSKAFVYSYYHYIPRRKPKSLGDGGEFGKDGGDEQMYEPPKYIKKRGAEMKMIFGNIDPDDYLPGGAKNPFEPNPLAYVKHERNTRPVKGLVGMRRVQEAKPSNLTNRKVAPEEKDNI